MSVPDWPRVPAKYVYDASRTEQVECGCSASSIELVQLLSAVAIVQAAHVGERAYGIVTDDEYIAGSIEGKLTDLQKAVAADARRSTPDGARLGVAMGEAASPLQLPLTVSLHKHKDVHRLLLSYDSLLLSWMEAQWFLGHVARAIEAVTSTSDPEIACQDISLTDKDERDLIDRYGRSDPPPDVYPASCTTLHSFFQHAAELYPDSVALQFDDRTFTFRQLSEFATAIACDLVRKGVKPGEIVPLCIDKSVEMILGMLAIQLSGAGYLNLEPKFPSDRKRGILEELRETGLLSPVALVQPDERSQWTTWSDDQQKPLVDAVDIVQLAQPYLQDGISPSDQVSLPSVEASSPAYAIYTSGSTGKPKGIIVEHRNVAAFLRNYRGVFGRAHGERVLQFPSFAFDVSVMNIWDTFAHGSTLCMTDSATLMSGLAEAVLRLDCTLVDLTPTVSALLFDYPEAEPREGESVLQAWRRAGFKIKVVNTGGERVEAWVRDAWRERGVRVVIDYGPSETTVGVIANQTTDTEGTALPIGRPTGNNVIKILSPNLKPVPLGCIGEICVAGEQVTRGYVRQELNAKAFFEDPQLGRVYRTGDLGRFVGDGSGSIDCLGRMDGQVKVNGLRIEIGEIEKHLTPALHPDLARGVVDRIETDAIPVGLVALLLPVAGSDLFDSTEASNEDTVILRSHSEQKFKDVVEAAKIGLAKALPQYMIPRYWLPVNRIPTQGMGKTDRKTLRALAESHSFRRSAGQNKSSEHTRDEWHDAMRRAWSKLLRVPEDDIGDDDQFTKLGGDSIAFTRVIGLLRREGFIVSFAALAGARTLTECATILRQTQASATSSSSPAPVPFSLLKDKDATLQEMADELNIATSDIEDVLPTAPPQDAILAGSFDSTHYYAQAVYPVHKDISLARLQEGLTQLIRRHANMRTCFALPSAEDRLVQVVLKPDADQVCRSQRIVHLELDKTGKDASGTLNNFLESDREQHHFACGRVALSFAFLEHVDGNKLVWGMHHAVSDGWTLELLTADLRDLCFGRTLPDRPAYSSFVSWWDARDGQSETDDFWRRYLNGAKSLSWPPPRHEDESGLATTAEVVEHWSGDLVKLSKTHGITPAIASRLAIAVALGRVASTDEITLGIVRSGRDVDVNEAENMIGCCVSVLPSRLRVDAEKSLLDLANEEAEADRQARVHQRVTLSELAKLGKFGDRSAIFDILVTYQSLADVDDDGTPWPIRQPPEHIRMPTSYALSFEITPSRQDKDSLELACFYDRSLVDEGSVRDVVRSIAKVLDYLTIAPCIKLGDLRLDSAAPRPQPAQQPAQHSNGKAVDESRVQPLIDAILPLWSSILRVAADEIDADSTFAALGGDSISAMRLSSTMTKAGYKIPVNRLLKLATIRQQAEWLAAQQ